MKKTELIVQFKSSNQISVDDWDVYHPTLKITDETKVSEILEWYKKQRPEGPMEVRVIEL